MFCQGLIDLLTSSHFFFFFTLRPKQAFIFLNPPKFFPIVNQRPLKGFFTVLFVHSLPSLSLINLIHPFWLYSLVLSKMQLKIHIGFMPKNDFSMNISNSMCYLNVTVNDFESISAGNTKKCARNVLACHTSS